MPARQQHGLDFEAWIKKTFFKSYVQTGHTDKWDALSVKFKDKYAIHTAKFSGLPISLKMCKYGCAIGLGDALRQYENDEDFLIIVGFWRQKGNVKQMVAVEAAKVLAGDWKDLFASQTLPEDDEDDEMVVETVSAQTKPIDPVWHKLNHLDGIIKNTPHYKDARKLARQEKKTFQNLGVTLNPKIDSKTQRRLQCSLGFNTFSSKFVRRKIQSMSGCTFWGESVPNF